MNETISQLASRVGRTRGTVWRWVSEGVMAGGRVVKLAAVRVGGRWEVTGEAWEKFERDCNPGAQPSPESPAAARRRIDAEYRAGLLAVGLDPDAEGGAG